MEEHRTTQKKLKVPAKLFVNMVAHDVRVRYPVMVEWKTEYGCGSRLVRKPQELAAMCWKREILYSSLTGVEMADGTILLKTEQDGWYRLEKSILTDCLAGERLSIRKTKYLYRYLAGADYGNAFGQKVNKRRTGSTQGSRTEAA